MVPLLLLLACAAHVQRTGLVEVDAGRPRLLEESGAHWKLAAGADDVVFQNLRGCGVSVTGIRVGHRIVVGDWRVVDAGDGSEPMVGRLTRYGAHWVVADRNSGVSISLDPDSLAGLEKAENHLVLVVGYTIGPHEARVVSWRLLDEAP